MDGQDILLTFWLVWIDDLAYSSSEICEWMLRMFGDLSYFHSLVGNLERAIIHQISRFASK